MLWKLVLTLTLVPLAELYVLLKLSEATGFPFTVAIILGTGVLGAVVARLEGLRVLANINAELARGRIPGDGLMDGAMVLVAAALLVTPGLLTDTVGFLLLLPQSRRLGREWMKRWLKRKMEEGQVTFYRRMGFGPIRKEPPPGSPPLEDEDEWQ